MFCSWTCFEIEGKRNLKMVYYFIIIINNSSKIRPAELSARCLFSDNLVLSTGLIIWIGHRKEIRKLTFRALRIRSDDGLTLETSASESLYVGQFTLSTQLITPNYLVILPTDAAPQFLSKLAPFIRLFSEISLKCYQQEGNWFSQAGKTFFLYKKTFNYIYMYMVKPGWQNHPYSAQPFMKSLFS